MLTFSSHSWHIRLVQVYARAIDSTAIYVPTNLCTHFWATTACVGLTPILVAVVPGTLVATGLWWLVSRPVLWHRRHFRPVLVEHRPSLVLSWLSARKRRVCPLIKVRDDSL